MFLYPLGLLALLGLPVVVALHLFRRRFRPRTVSAVFLWEPVDRTPIAGRRRERLRQSGSLACELLAALALALALAGPRGCGTDPAEHLVFVLDGSASMAAVVEGSSAMQRAREQIDERIESGGPATRVTVVLSGPSPRVVVGPAAFAAEASELLSQLEPSAPRHSLAGAIGLASELAGEGRVALLTDHYEPHSWPATFELIGVGRGAPNVGFTVARREPSPEEPDRDRLTIGVRSYSSLPQARLLKVALAETVVLEEELQLEPHTTRVFELEVASSPEAALLTLGSDALAIDDRATLLSPSRRVVRLFASPGTGRALGLAADSRPLGRLLDMLPGVSAASSAQAAHGLIQRSLPEGTKPALCVLAQGQERKDWIGPFLYDARHPLLEGLTLEGLVWSMAEEPALGGVPLISTGAHVLAWELEGTPAPVYVLNYDAQRGTLHRGPDWPILLSNFARIVAESLPGLQASNLVSGQALQYRGTPERAITLHGPRGSVTLDAPDGVLVYTPDSPGLWTLTPEGEPAQSFAVRFLDQQESDLSQCASGHRPGTAEALNIKTEHTWLESLLILGALLAFVVDWWVLRGRAGAQLP